MQFIVLEIQTNDQGVVSTLLNTYSDRSLAEQKYHLILSAAAVSQLPSHAAVIMTNEGVILAGKQECYHYFPAPVEPSEE